MRVLHLVPSIDLEASGPSHSVPSLCDALFAASVQVSLHILATAPVRPCVAVCVVASRPIPLLRRLGVSPEMKAALRSAARQVDILHNHSLWMMPNVYPAAAVRGTKCKLVCSPRGTLSEYALTRSKWRKKVMWWLGQGEVLRKSAFLHATAESEYQDIRRVGLSNPVAIIPNGIDLPELPELGSRTSDLGLNDSGGKSKPHPHPASPEDASAFSQREKGPLVLPLGKEEKSEIQNPKSKIHKRLLFLSRIHPKKGIDILLQAWSRLQTRFPDWELLIAGPDNDGHLPAMQALARTFDTQRVTFAGGVYGAEKSRAYFDADLFVLPSHSENFGMVVAEALAHGLPAIVSKGAPWAGLETNRCGWWIENNAETLADTLAVAMNLTPEDRRAMGMRGREWMARDFSWHRIAQMMHQAYLWALGGGAPPDFFRMR